MKLSLEEKFLKNLLFSPNRIIIDDFKKINLDKCSSHNIIIYNILKKITT